MVRVSRILHRIRRVEQPIREYKKRRKYDRLLKKMWMEHRGELAGSGVPDLLQILEQADKRNMQVGIRISPGKLTVQAVTPNTAAEIEEIWKKDKEVKIRQNENIEAMMQGAILAAIGLAANVGGHHQLGHVLGATGAAMAANRITRNAILQLDMRRFAYERGREIGEYIYRTFVDDPDTLQHAVKSAAAVVHEVPHIQTLRELARGIAHSILELQEGKG